ncbi:MAG: tyrosine-protein phosphatase, partial [Alphaproteobacteria bacterium]
MHVRFFPARFRISLVAFGLIAAAAIWVIALQVTGNYHQVIAGELYRAAQPNSEQLVRYRNSDGIRTVLNLRGGASGKTWYDDEIATSRRLGLVHVDFRMSSSRDLTQARAEELITLMRGLPKPLLIHCQAGADRSGLAAALYLAAIANRPEEDAESQLSLRFGHIGIPLLSASWAMDRSFEDL